MIEELLEKRKKVNKELDSYLLREDSIKYAPKIIELLKDYSVLNKEYLQYLKEENRILSMNLKEKPEPCNWYKAFEYAKKNNPKEFTEKKLL